MKRQYIKKTPKRAIDVVNYIYNERTFGYHDETTKNNTFWDKKCTSTAFHQGGYRSIDALFGIAKGYFPRLTKDNFVQSILNEKTYAFYGCPKVRTTTVYRVFTRPSNVYTPITGVDGTAFRELEFINKYLK